MRSKTSRDHVLDSEANLANAKDFRMPSAGRGERKRHPRVAVGRAEAKGALERQACPAVLGPQLADRRDDAAEVRARALYTSAFRKKDSQTGHVLSATP